jgi:hypothetical protein
MPGATAFSSQSTREVLISSLVSPGVFANSKGRLGHPSELRKLLTQSQFGNSALGQASRNREPLPICTGTKARPLLTKSVAVAWPRGKSINFRNHALRLFS